ncbi:YheU family protein [Thiovibrio frasassiensis]|uniref:YheU family protein n=1 Tax=Thiovibrio frasassiensis TaxID=2984131 RepID=A0A9X4MK22_9BACT|nr:YheU family protein [Thiovibrio frasassiensis]MDG4476968.1 YheU family protein [Thiovibrio frasassiensis]
MSEHKSIGLDEEGIDVPYERLDPETLRNVIEEFVTRDGADWGEAGGTLEEKVGQVMQQLRSRKIKIVFELNSETTNIVVNR